MNRRAIVKKIADAKLTLARDAEWLGEKLGVDAALIAAVRNARGRGDSYAANQIDAVSKLLRAVVVQMGGPGDTVAGGLLPVASELEPEPDAGETPEPDAGETPTPQAVKPGKRR